MERLKFLLIPALFLHVISGENCPRGLTQNCACSLSGTQWHITCSGYDLVNITRYLPPNTAVFRYTAMEEFVNLADVDFSRLTELTAFQIKDPRDYKILDRKISPMTGEPKLFSGLSKLEELRINVNWEMPELPNLLHGLDNLQILDFSNTRLIYMDNLVTVLQGLRNNTKMKVLNLWNMQTIQHNSSPSLHLDLGNILEPLSQSRLEELNIGYNAVRTVSPGLIQYTPWLKRLIIRNNVMIPIATSSLMTEVFLHKSIVDADFSEQGFRPSSEISTKFDKHNDRTIPVMRSAEQLLSVVNATELYRPSNHSHTITMTQFNNYEHDNPAILRLEQFLTVVHRTPPTQAKRAYKAEELPKRDLLPRVHNIIMRYLTCFILLYNDTCGIFRPECNDIKDLLVEDHLLFCDLLNFFFQWHFTGILCDYIPRFNEIINPDCGGCLVIPAIGSLRKMDLSNLNVYDLVLEYSSYRDRPLCFHPNTSIQYFDYTASAVHGYTEINRYFSAEIKGLESIEVMNNSGNILTDFIASNFPRLKVLNSSHNLITMAQSQKFVDIAKSIEILDLSHNQIKDVTVDMFAELEELRHLDLSYNLIKEFNVSLSSSIRLEYLDLSYNVLNSLPQYTIHELNEIAVSNTSHVIHVDIGSNVLICSCATRNFVQWVLVTHPPNIAFVNSEKFYCTNKYSYHVALQSIKTSELNFECYENVFYGCLGAFCAVIIVLAGLVYKRRFFIRHKWYTLTKKARRGTYNQLNHKYHAFICFDEMDRRWIDFEAKRNLEGLQITYGEEDIEYGQNIHEGVSQLIEESRRCILVLSPDFVSSPSNMYHMRGVEEKLKNTGNDIVIIIKLRPLNRVGMDQTLKELMERRECLEWKEDIPDAQKFFWEKLTDILQKPCEELYDALPDAANRPPRHNVSQHEENSHHDDPRDEENAPLVIIQ